MYGAVKSAGPDCASLGWEDVWTCDGTEYVEGDGRTTGSCSSVRRCAQSIPSIEVGAVGVGDRGAWSDWDDKVMKGAGNNIDFYVVHQYGSNGDVSADKVLGLPEPAVARDHGRRPGATPTTASTRSRRSPSPSTTSSRRIDDDDDQLMTQGGQRVLPRRDDRADGDERRDDRQPMEPGQRPRRERHRLRPHRRRDASAQSRVLRDGAVVALRRRARAGRRRTRTAGPLALRRAQRRRVDAAPRDQSDRHHGPRRPSRSIPRRPGARSSPPTSSRPRHCSRRASRGTGRRHRASGSPSLVTRCP